jgi:hypothetical protein
MSPDGEAVDGGRAPDTEVMARTAAMVALWARGRPSTRHTHPRRTPEPPGANIALWVAPAHGTVGARVRQRTIGNQDECAV